MRRGRSKKVATATASSDDSDAAQGLEHIERICLGNPKKLDGATLLALAAATPNRSKGAAIIGHRASSERRSGEKKNNRKKDEHHGSSSQAAAAARDAGRPSKRKKQPTLYEQYYSDSSETDDPGDELDGGASAMLGRSSAAGARSYASVVAGSLRSTAGASAAASGAPPKSTGLAESQTSDRALTTLAFEVGMDVNILVQQLLTNAIATLFLEDEDNTGRFGDHDLVCVASAIGHNTSLTSLQLRWLQVTDVSLVPLFNSLEKHPNIRSIDLCGTRGAEASSKALRRLVCRNSSILHVMTDDTRKTKWRMDDDEVIELATRHNALVCPGISNPYDKRVIASIIDKREEQQLLERQLALRRDNPFVPHTTVIEMEGGYSGGSLVAGTERRVISLGGTVISPPTPLSASLAHPLPSNKSSDARSKGKKSVQFSGVPQGGKDETADDEAHRVATAKAALCKDYMLGSCRFGSRCSYVHPDRTVTATQQADRLRVEQQQQELMEQQRTLAALSSRRQEGQVDDIIDSWWLMDATSDFAGRLDDEAFGAIDGDDDTATVVSFARSGGSRRQRGVAPPATFTLRRQQRRNVDVAQRQSDERSGGPPSAVPRRWRLSDRDLVAVTSAVCLCCVALSLAAH